MFNSIVMLIVTFNLLDLIIILDTPKDSLPSIFHSVDYSIFMISWFLKRISLISDYSLLLRFYDSHHDLVHPLLSGLSLVFDVVLCAQLFVVCV